MTMRLTAAALVGLGVLVGCQSGPRDLSTRQWTEDMAFRISAEPVPPHARESVKWKVVVRDRKTGEPIETGRGQIFSTSRDGNNAYAPLEKGAELGTYYATLQFITAGDWAMAIRFQRDTTRKLERMDWMQQVFTARGER